MDEHDSQIELKPATDGKWIKGLDPEMPASGAATRILSIRLRAAMETLELARSHARVDPDSLRRVRVATRRARSAVDVFSPFLPKKSAKALRRYLKQIRNLAGEPRALGLEREALRSRLSTCEDRHREAIAYSIGHLSVLESQAIERLCAAESLDLDAYRSFAEKCSLPLAGGRAAQTLIEHSRGPLRDVESAFVAEARRPLVLLEQLHELRLCIKRLRYTYEIFRSCIEPARFKAVYRSARSVQNKLGRMNDLHELHERVASIRDADGVPEQIRRSLDSFVQQLDKEREFAKDRFVVWWDSPASAAPRALRESFVFETSPAAQGRTLVQPDIAQGIDRAIDSALKRIIENGTAV